MDRLQEEGIRGADLVFACIGPALQIYSQYAKVVDAQDREIPLGGDPEAKEPHKRGYLAYVWEAVGRAALEQVLGRAEANARDGTSGALEEDSRMTALFLWTLQTTAVGDVNGGAETDDGDQAEEDEDGENGRSSKKGGFNLPFDVVRRFAQPLGIHLPEWEGRVIETAKGVVRIIPVAERTKQLFGDDGVQIVASRVTQVKAGPEQLTMALFPESDAPRIGGRGRGRGSAAKKPSDRSSTVG